MGRAQTSAPIIGALLTLASSLKLEVVAHGVETQVEADRLRAMGCTLGQGYLWSKPVPAEQAIALAEGAPPASGHRALTAA